MGNGQRAQAVSRRSILAALYLLFFTCQGGCARWEPVVVPPPAECADFSGVYWYPGYEKQSEVCTVVTKGGFGFGLPVPVRRERAHHRVPSGGWQQIIAPTGIEVRQQNCQQITFYAPYGLHYVRKNYDRVLEYLPREGVRYRVVTDLDYHYSTDYFRVDKWWALDVDLRPGELQEVRWGEESLYLRYRFRDEGFGAGWSRHYLTLRLGKLPGGALRYEVRHDQTGGDGTEIVCTLEPAADASSEDQGGPSLRLEPAPTAPGPAR